MDDETLDDLQLDGIHVIQKRKSFRFGVDAVLLANFAKIKKNALVMDMCSGTGIIPFVIAGKTQALKITGLEIQKQMVEMANRSVKYNKLEEKIEFINGDLKDKRLISSLPKYEVVTVNPPYKLQNSGILNPNNKEAIARHEICCTLEDVIAAARLLLKDNGRLFMVHRPERLIDIFSLLREYKIEPKRIQLVYPNIKKPPNIVLIEAQRDGGKFLKWEPNLYVYNEKGEYSEEINRMYGR